MPPAFQTLTLSQIDSSPEIATWLSQFNSEEDRLTAKQMLLRLRFVSSDRFSLWLKQTLADFSIEEKHAIFAVRKLVDPQGRKDSKLTYFDEQGCAPKRPSGSQGSEDLVNSVIANHLKNTALSQVFFDHPSIEVMRREKIRHIVLIDDSIGSGNRIVEFVNALLANKTFRSWWGFGWIKVTVISYARNSSGAGYIYKNVHEGSKPDRKFRNKDKISFSSAYVYKSEWMEQNWGEKYAEIHRLCVKTTVVSKNYRLGYKNSFSNIIFFHSVPNNIPGVLHFNRPSRRHALMPNRSMPNWLMQLLSAAVVAPELSQKQSLTPELQQLLQLIKSGIRAESTLALRLNLDVFYAQQLVEQAISFGLLTQQKRLTDDAQERLHHLKKQTPVEKFNYELYIPTSWRVG